MAKAIECFQRIIENDPFAGIAYAGLADAYSNLGPDTIDKARLAARKAIELDDNLAEAHAAMGSICELFLPTTCSNAFRSDSLRMTSLWAGLIPRQLYHIVSLMYRHLRDTTLGIGKNMPNTQPSKPSRLRHQDKLLACWLAL